MSDAGNPGGAPPPAAPWYNELDEVHRAHVASRGWDRKPIEEVAREAVVAQRRSQAEFSAVHGVPADQLLRLPKDAADPGWTELHKRLGVPDRPDDYKFEGLKYADGTAPDEAFVASMRALAHELKLPADRAGALAQRFIAHTDAGASEDTRARAAARGANEAELRRTWGANHDYYRFQVNRTTELLGLPPALVSQMETQPAEQYLRFMDALRGLASKMGEAELLRGDRGGNARTLTRDEAIVRRDDLMKDGAWTQRLLGGDAAARRELEDLSRIIVGPPPAGASSAPNMR